MRDMTYQAFIRGNSLFHKIAIDLISHLENGFDDGDSPKALAVEDEWQMTQLGCYDCILLFPLSSTPDRRLRIINLHTV